MNSGEQPLVDGASPCLALRPDQQRPQTMMLRLSSRFALRTGWFECSAHFLRRGYANFDNTRYDSVRSVRAWMHDREIKRRSKCSRLSRFHFLTGIALPQLPDSKIEGISHRDHRSQV